MKRGTNYSINYSSPPPLSARLEKKESARDAMESRKSGTAKRLATFISGLVECMCFAGVIFGWTSLVFVLKNLKYFENLCESAANTTINQTTQGMI